MPNARTIFVGGASGSGKTFLLTRLTVLHPYMTHVVASSLIQRSTVPGILHRLSVGTLDQAAAFQADIVARFQAIRSQVPGLIVLDGHYVVPTLQGQFCIPLNVFKGLAIDAFVVIRSAPETLAERLRLRTDASWWDGQVESLRAVISLEIQHAYEITQALGRDITVVDEADAEAANLLWNEISG